MIKFSVNKLIIFLLLSFTFSDSYIDLKKNITSLLNTTDLIYFNDNVLVSTSGGLYSITNSLLNIDNNSDNIFMKVNNNKLYIGSSFPGRLSLFDNDLNIESIIEYPDFDEILDIFFSDNYIFAVGNLNQNYILIQYSINELNEIQYLNYFDTFPVLFETINDLYILPAVRKSTLFGEGIGAGTKPVLVFNKKEKVFLLGEIDNKRIIMELGYIVGVFLVFFKWISVIIFNFYALFKFRDKEKLVYIPLLLFVSVQLMLGTVSYTVSFISFIFWISLGLLFTSLNKENKIHG